MSSSAHAAALHFLEHETEFHLGFLPTEQSHPATRTLEADFKRSSIDGVRTLQRPDRDVLAMARRVLAGEAFARLVADGDKTLSGGGRIVFSGCGATGRLSILLEAMWRRYRADRGGTGAGDEVFSLMTGGDFALIKSVESFEDYQSFGRRQVADMGFASRDMLVAVTEGGETSSVIGTVKEAAERGGRVHLLFNNPAPLLRERLVRCREVIDDARVSALDLSCGPMALAGSTRMQATTSEQLVAGAFLETLAARMEGRTAAPDAARGFARALDRLGSDAGAAQLAERIDFEADIYARGGLVTYLADDYLLDLFTDTTERSPTFMLPPFRRDDDDRSPLPWAFVKNPIHDTKTTWARMLGRAPRCLDWTAGDYRMLGAAEPLAAAPPTLNREALYRYAVGNEPAPERFARPGSGAVVAMVEGAPGNEALAAAATGYPVLATWRFGAGAEETPLGLERHLAFKLAINTISTGVMTKLGRVSGNWMSWVGVSNKKLIDRAARLVSELGGLPYREACFALFEAMAAADAAADAGGEKPSAVQVALKRRKEGPPPSRCGF